MTKEYKSATAFRTALEERLKQQAVSQSVDVNRLRRRVAFDRLLARLFSDPGSTWKLKGGYAMELRFESARSTIDIDLSLPVPATNETSRELLQAAAALSLGDWFDYLIGKPVMDLDAAPYGGARFPVEVRMDGRFFAKFHLDVGIGDAKIDPPERIQCPDVLAFAGIKPATVTAICQEQQFAEKIHAYTLPRSRQNSRVKDLVDLALLINEGSMDQARLRTSLAATFDRRQTHSLPAELLAPPAEWGRQFSPLAENALAGVSMSQCFSAVNQFFISLQTANENN